MGLTTSGAKQLSKKFFKFMKEGGIPIIIRIVYSLDTYFFTGSYNIITPHPTANCHLSMDLSIIPMGWA